MAANPWDDDFKRFPDFARVHRFESHGYKCSIQRHQTTLHWLGYVHLPKGHPDYIESAGFGEVAPRLSDIKVHGGVTFATEGKVGFDTAHAGDIVPVTIPSIITLICGLGARLPCATYKDFDFVKAQTVLLAKQLKERESAGAVKSE
jgi:hypothetical protein